MLLNDAGLIPSVNIFITCLGVNLMEKLTSHAQTKPATSRQMHRGIPVEQQLSNPPAHPKHPPRGVPALFPKSGETQTNPPTHPQTHPPQPPVQCELATKQSPGTTPVQRSAARRPMYSTHMHAHVHECGATGKNEGVATHQIPWCSRKCPSNAQKHSGPHTTAKSHEPAKPPPQN